MFRKKYQTLLKNISIAIVIFLIAFLSNAKSSEVKPNRGLLSWSAFQCSIYAEFFENTTEQTRLFSLGYKTSRALLEDIKSKKISKEEREKIPMGILLVMGGPSIDFIVGRIYSSALEEAYDDVVKTNSYGALQGDSSKWVNGEARKAKAERKYRQSSCELLGVSY